MSNILCQVYVDMFGFIVGDKVCLVDIELWIEVEDDLIIYGEEVKFGGGKVICDGMGQGQMLVVDCVDLVFINVLIVDYWGIVKVDIGVKDGWIFVIGKVGNFDIQFNVIIFIGVLMEVIVVEGKIVIVGGIDIYIYWICLQQVEEVLVFGVIIMVGGGIGLVVGIYVIICILGLWYILCMLQVVDSLLVNIGLLGKGNVFQLDVLCEQVVVGVIGLKIYEDWGVILVVIDCVLIVVDEMDIQVVLYSDILNEFGFVEDIFVVIGGCIIYIFYIEGVGGGYVLDIIIVCVYLNILLLFINLMLFYIFNIIDEYFDMLMVCYYLDLDIVEDVVFVELCICWEIIVVEDVLYDFGVFLFIFFDLQVMGCVGEVIFCIWQVVYCMKVQCGVLVEEIGDNDNFCVKCYIVKYIINLVLIYGIVYEVGFIEVGKLVDFVVWLLVFFGVKLVIVIKGGMIVIVLMGDINVFILILQLVYYCLMFGVLGSVCYYCCFIFLLQVVVVNGVVEWLNLCSVIVVVKGCCMVQKVDMVYNSLQFNIIVDVQIYEVWVDGEFIISELVDVLLMV